MKNLITIFAFVLTIGVVNAQENGPRQQRSPEEMTKMQVERLTKELDLSKPQQDSIQKYILITSIEQQKLFKEAGDDREAAMKSMQALREKQNQKIKTFLNQEQSKKYDEYTKQRGRGFGGPGGQRTNN